MMQFEDKKDAWMPKNREKNGRHDAILRSFLNEYRWLGSSPKRASGDLEHREKKKFNLLQQKQWWKSSLTAFWSRSRYFFPHANTQNFPIESWTVDIIVFESWHELRSYSICAFAIQTAFRLLLFALYETREKNKSRIFPESMNQGMKKNQQCLKIA